MSSELSIELSHFEEPPPSLSSFIHEDEECDEEDEELPSFVEAAKSQRLGGRKEKKKPLCFSPHLLGVTLTVFVPLEPPLITEGVFVWHKLRNYPFWPALVGATWV